ncbi:MAG: hypothetical protein OHK0046_33250 [Anaerolineae bacterium]
MNDQQVDELLFSLLHMRKRPGMYVYTVEPESIITYLHGVQTVLHVLGHKVTERNVLIERGWDPHGGTHPYAIMRSRGIPEALMIDEIMGAFITALQRHFSISDEHIQSLQQRFGLGATKT